MMAQEPKNRAERRARVFLRAPQLRPQPAPVPDPKKLSSGIRPLVDPKQKQLEDLLTGTVFNEVPFAKIDEDLIAPVPFTATPVEYVASFQLQVCARCGGKQHIFAGLFEQKNTMKGPQRIRTERLPANEKPTMEVRPGANYIPCCPQCLA